MYQCPRNQTYFLCQLIKYYWFSVSDFRFLSAFYGTAERELNQLLTVVYFECITRVEEEILNIQLMQMNHVPRNSCNHADSECFTCVGESVREQSFSVTSTQTLHISTQVAESDLKIISELYVRRLIMFRVPNKLLRARYLLVWKIIRVCIVT